MSNNNFTNKKGLKIQYHKYIPEKPGRIGIILHGVGEYPDVYRPFFEKLEANDIGYYAITHQGHGKSEGRRGHVNRFTDYTADVKQLIEIAKNEGHEIDFMFGHSMGGLIAIYFNLQYIGDASKLILSAPALGIARKIPLWIRLLIKPMSLLWPTFSQKSGLAETNNDPMYANVLSARWLTELQAAQEYCIKNAVRFSSPLHIFHSTNDDLASFESAYKFWDLAKSDVKTFSKEDYPGHNFLKHTNEEERKQTIDKIIKLIND
ncbi:alpha/beta fold hydrolase [Candidatus Dojkabacteria bacterium]|nr:alpha/beta fold hydrolase [Candidatus Dojkabacteria bacterium]